jgi:hypothetical protein
MGAVDVVPFIPVRGIEVAEAIGIARRFGQFLGGLGVPVYYYEDAATRPEREKLPDIRKGQYEALEAKLQDPAWAPDEGPAEQSPARRATQPARHELLEQHVVRPIDRVSRAPGLAFTRGHDHSQKGPNHAVEDKELRFRPVAENAPHPGRQPRDHFLAAELAAPAVEDSPPRLQADPPGRPAAHIPHLTEPAQEPGFAERDGLLRAREIDERQEGNQGDKAQHHGTQRLPGPALDEQRKGDDAETDEHSDEGAASLRKDHDKHLAHQQSGQERGA